MTCAAPTTEGALERAQSQSLRTILLQFLARSAQTSGRQVDGSVSTLRLQVWYTALCRKGVSTAPDIGKQQMIVQASFQVIPPIFY
ncbi:hypothetical protein PoB_006908500 [Plakobranchus ocellatus]|uniref:Uncharacterized protein n=1 Tax=Plakobranchus ocellatus TaxID=259542 RepID=A0AAV4DEP3_9GAST|nr:hypothetical protein PoB_006908500 [Plakobranchus ocellatus]